MRKKIKHCILMVTYNHEKYIQYALDSIFENSTLPDKVILRDDCSTDRTWEIVEKYKQRYPDIIDCEINKENLGIFQNINSVWKLGAESDCDILSWCSGDDFLEKNLIDNLNTVIITNSIDVSTEKFIIVSNSKELYPDGTEKIINNYKYRNTNDYLYQRIKSKISYREVGLSRNLIKINPPIRYDVGLYADMLFCLDYETRCTHMYFANFIGACYRTGVGTVYKEKLAKLFESKIIVNSVIKESYVLSKKSIRFLDYENSFYKIKLEYNKANLIAYLKELVLNPKEIKISSLIALISPNIKNKIKKIIGR